MSGTGPRPHSGESNLRDLQLLLWLGQQLVPESPGYNVPFAFEIDGAIEREHFEAAVCAFVRRCDAVRLVFEEIDGVPRQRVAAHADFALEQLDFADDLDPPARLNAWVRERAIRPFRLPERLFDTALLRMGQDRFAWYWNQHHLTTDGWSYVLMLRHVAEYYRLSRLGLLADAPALPSFMEFVAEEKARARGGSSGAGGSDAAAALEWYGRRGAKSLAERRITRRLGGARTDALRRVAGTPAFRSLGADLSVLRLLATATAAYIHRVTGRRQLSLGVPFRHRETRLEREVIGLLQEVVSIEVDVAEEETFASLSVKCHEAIWRSLRRAHSGASGSALGRYEVLLDYPTVSLNEFAGLPVRARWVHPEFGDGQRSLFLQLVDFDRAGELVLYFDANEGSFGPGMDERAAGHFINTLDRLLENPDHRIDSAGLLDAEERELVVGTFNRTDEAHPAGESLAQLFESQADETPDSAALVFGDHSLTYAEIDRAANRLATHLRARGAGPGTSVASCVERAIGAVVGLLAIWKCGAAYVPIDPAYPKERVAFVLEDSSARLLLTQNGLLPALPDARPETIVLDHLDLENEPADRLPQSSRPADLAYVIYTSGSTGKPKGVAMSQQALVNLVRWQVRQPTPLRRPRTLQFTPLTFDVSLQEILSTWGAGGTLVLIPEATRRDPEATLRLIEEQRIERLFIIYTPFQRLAEAADRARWAPASLREVITAGEQLQVTPAVRRFFERLPGCTLHNQYGPSETHIVTAYTLEGAPADWPPLPSIGRPIANTQAYVLDSGRGAVPVGVVGELYIGGAQVADGYIGRPEPTAERFVPDPFRPGAGRRLYKTGDLARWRPDGTLEFLGRLDHQIKLRGYRIELGEIESVLAEHPAVRQAVVVARRGAAGDPRLVAYVVPQRGVFVEVEDGDLVLRLRRWLKEKLPEPMVPSAFVSLGALPLTPNGKVDRLALPEPDGSRPALEAAYVAPVSELEGRIAEVWRRVLGVDRVGRHDNFFDLGGHSLLLVEIHLELRRLMSRPISLVDLFRYPTIESLLRFAAGTDLRPALDAISARAARQRMALASAARPRPVRTDA